MLGIIAFITICAFGLGALFIAVGTTGDIGFFPKLMRRTGGFLLLCSIISTIVLQLIH